MSVHAQDPLNTVQYEEHFDRLLGLLAHELRNPLAPLCTAVELLGRSNVSPATQERARVIMLRQVRQMSALIDELADFARLGSGRIVLAREQMSLQALVQRAVDDARETLEERGMHLAVDLPAEAVTLDVDVAWVAQALAQIIMETTRRSNSETSIALNAVAHEGTVRVTIALRCGDPPSAAACPHPAGLSPAAGADTAALPASTPTHDAVEGFSVALALAQRVLSLHGGTVRWHVDPDTGGKTVTMSLPSLA